MVYRKYIIPSSKSKGRSPSQRVDDDSNNNNTEALIWWQINEKGRNFLFSIPTFAE